QFANLLDAERSLVQKSGYFARSAPANGDDLRLIQSMVDLAVERSKALPPLMRGNYIVRNLPFWPSSWPVTPETLLSALS
ncbi:hypothetical protein AB9F34_34590, partial [Rhizobium leguminosarum]